MTGAGEGLLTGGGEGLLTGAGGELAPRAGARPAEGAPAPEVPVAVPDGWAAVAVWRAGAAAVALTGRCADARWATGARGAGSAGIVGIGTRTATRTCAPPSAAACASRADLIGVLVAIPMPNAAANTTQTPSARRTCFRATTGTPKRRPERGPARRLPITEWDSTSLPSSSGA